MCVSGWLNRWDSLGHTDLKFGTAWYQKRWPKVKITVKITVKIKRVKGQGRRVLVKVVWEVLYPNDWWKVRHTGVFIV